MFELFGYVIGLVLVAFIVTLLTEFIKRFSFITKIAEWFGTKVKKVSWYQVESILITLIILIILSILDAITLGVFAIILNAIIIGFMSNGIFTYQFIKDLMLKFKITSKIIEKIEAVKPKISKKSTKKRTTTKKKK